MSWELEVSGLKHYPHFDADIGLGSARKLVNDPAQVARNPFYPFIMYLQEWQPFRSKSPRPDKKERKIRYAARKDAYIFAKYRHELAELYEQRLEQLGLSDCVIAYRRVLKAPQIGKCNIDFAKEAFDAVKLYGDCCFIALDISKFFEHLDHQRLKQCWESLLGVDALPADHEAVFNAVTKYSYVSREELYRRLGYIEEVTVKGKKQERYAKKFSEVPRKLCSNKDFRELVVGKTGGQTSLIAKNNDSWGIPQGAPISDFLANLYLLDFDVKCNALAKSHGGVYRRYSDDILLVLPVSLDIALRTENLVIELIASYGSKLSIKPEKTSIVKFCRDGKNLEFRHIKGQQGKNGAEYLGFRFDGKAVHFRDSTVANLYRKISVSAKSHAYSTVSRFPGKSSEFLKRKLSPSTFFERFGRVRDYDPGVSKSWTFHTYALRAAKAFGQDGAPIIRQIRNAKRIATERLLLAFEKALSSQEVQ